MQSYFKETLNSLKPTRYLFRDLSLPEDSSSFETNPLVRKKWLHHPSYKDGRTLRKRRTFLDSQEILSKNSPKDTILTLPLGNA